MSWLDDPRTWIPVAAIAAQAVISWWRVGEQDKDITANRAHHDRELSLLRVEVDSLREWRAQAREKLRRLEQNESADEDS